MVLVRFNGSKTQNESKLLLEKSNPSPRKNINNNEWSVFVLKNWPLRFQPRTKLSTHGRLERTKPRLWVLFIASIAEILANTTRGQRISLNDPSKINQVLAPLDGQQIMCVCLSVKRKMAILEMPFIQGNVDWVQKKICALHTQIN